MSIIKIDEIIDRIMDDYYLSHYAKLQFDEANFVKHQSDLNTMMQSYTNTLDLSEVYSMVTNGDTKGAIFEIIKRYIALFTFLTIGYFYKFTDNGFINNIVEITKNQSSYAYKIDNFFNSESNAIVIRYYMLIKNLKDILAADKQKTEALRHKLEYASAFEFLSSYNESYIDMHLKHPDNVVKGQNLIKTIIVFNLYHGVERKEINRMLELTEQMQGEYIFIDIVVPTQTHINLESIEKLLTKKEIASGYAYDLWKFLRDYRKKTLLELTPEQKIIQLINSGLIVPICDDFFLYNKDSEKYDRSGETTTSMHSHYTSDKSKDDTKIRFIINKIDKVANYYVNKEEAKKEMYLPLINRKAVLVNSVEDFTIISKYIKIGKLNAENQDYFANLVHYFTHAYVNFNTIGDSGFSIINDKTINIVRMANYAKGPKISKRAALQIRGVGKNTPLNMVGLLLPPNTVPLQCVRTRGTLDIRTISKSKNGLEMTAKFLQQSMLGLKKQSSAVYWLFDNDLDRHIHNSNAIETDKYEQIEKASVGERTKLLVAKLYDVVLDEMAFSINHLLNANNSKVNPQLGHSIIRYIESCVFPLSKNTEQYRSVINTIYDMSLVTVPAYDVKDDIIHGLDDPIPLFDVKLILDERESLIKQRTIIINTIGDDKTTQQISDESIKNAVCQHNVFWRKLSTIQKAQITKFTDDLHAFIQQYVAEGSDGAYICRSCQAQLDIRKYIPDGAFSDDTNKFVSFSMPIETPLEESPDYEKLRMAIRHIDKIIDKIASTTNIPHYSGNSLTSRWHRRAAIKDVIDCIQLNNARMKKGKERGDKVYTQYGINKDLTTIWKFDLDNSIFVYSSKDKDFYKLIKMNNVIAYVLIVMALELNDSNILLMGEKSLCNFKTFEMGYEAIFGDLAVITNTKCDVSKIKNYKILCYILFIMSCTVAKYNMWYHEFQETNAKTTTAEKRKRRVPIIQKIMAHTIIDILNSIMENASQEHNRTYDTLSVKFYKKLANMFGSEDLYDRLYSNTHYASTVQNGVIMTDLIKSHLYSGKFVHLDGGDADWKNDAFLNNMVRTITIKHPLLPEHEEIIAVKTNKTNCPTGEFHDWKTTSGAVTCTLCKQIASDNPKTSDIQNVYRLSLLQNIGRRICSVDNKPHQYKGDTCKKCGNTASHVYQEKELLQLEQHISDVTGFEPQERTYEEKVHDKVLELFGSKMNTDFVGDFVKSVQNIMGAESEDKLFTNTYLVDHDYFGHSLDTPVAFKENKITFKKSHPFFNVNTLSYGGVFKNVKYEAFYDANTKILVGYKEESKNFVLSGVKDKYIKVAYSLYNKIKNIGYPSSVVDYKAKYDSMIADRCGVSALENGIDVVKKSIIHSLCETRLSNVKKCINECRMIISRIYNGATVQKIEPDNEEDYYSNPLKGLHAKYSKIIPNIAIADKNGKHMLFKHWKGLEMCISVDVGDAIDKMAADNTTFIITDALGAADKSSMLLIYYLCSEWKQMLAFNDPNNIKMQKNLANFVTDLVEIMFNTFNEEHTMNNLELKIHMFLLNSSTYISDLAIKSGLDVTEGLYTQMEEKTEEQQNEDQDAAAELEGYDIDHNGDMSDQDNEGGADE